MKCIRFKEIFIWLLIINLLTFLMAMDISLADEGNIFLEVKSIPTNGASKWEFFTLGDDSYLIVANFHNDKTRNIDSKVYEWNGSAFVESQSIPTNGALGWEFFIIGIDSYLVVANFI